MLVHLNIIRFECSSKGNATADAAKLLSLLMSTMLQSLLFDLQPSCTSVTMKWSLQ